MAHTEEMRVIVGDMNSKSWLLRISAMTEEETKEMNETDHIPLMIYCLPVDSYSRSIGGSFCLKYTRSQKISDVREAIF